MTKAVDTYPVVTDSVPDRYKTQKMCYKVDFKEYFMRKYCIDTYKTQEMCDKAFDACLADLKFVPDWFVTTEMLEKLDNVVFSSDDIVFS